MILGYNVNQMTDDGHHVAVRFFECRAGEPTSAARERAERHANDVRGWVEAVGVLSDAEMRLEIERGAIDARL